MKIVVHSPNWVGDAVLSLPALESLRFNFPDAQIYVASQENTKDIFSSLNFIKEVIPLPQQKNLQNLRASAQRLKSYGFHAGLLLPNSFGSAFLFYMAKIPDRWGYNRDGRNLLLTKGVTLKKPGETIHQVLYYLNLLSGLGLKTVIPSLKYPLTAEDTNQAESLLKSISVDFKKPLVILNPGAHYGPAKRWPAPNFAGLAKKLQDENNAEILLVGSADEADLSEIVASLLTQTPKILTGKTTLRQLAAVISRASLFVTNDSGPMHLANALSVPIVALFGPTDPNLTRPFQEPSLFLKKDVPCWPCAYRECPFDHRCMMQIRIEEVFQACQKFLP